MINHGTRKTIFSVFDQKRRRNGWKIEYDMKCVKHWYKLSTPIKMPSPACLNSVTDPSLLHRFVVRIKQQNKHSGVLHQYTLNRNTLIRNRSMQGDKGKKATWWEQMHA